MLRGKDSLFDKNLRSLAPVYFCEMGVDLASAESAAFMQ